MWQKIKLFLKSIFNVKFLKKLLNWKFLLCFGVAWMITNGWSYVFIGIGTIFNIGWMRNIGLSYLAFLWLPFTPEKLITIPIAIFLVKLFFPKEKGLYQELKEIFNEEKEKLKRKK